MRRWEREGEGVTDLDGRVYIIIKEDETNLEHPGAKTL